MCCICIQGSLQKLSLWTARVAKINIAIDVYSKYLFLRFISYLLQDQSPPKGSYRGIKNKKSKNITQIGREVENDKNKSNNKRATNGQDKTKPPTANMCSIQMTMLLTYCQQQLLRRNFQKPNKLKFVFAVQQSKAVRLSQICEMIPSLGLGCYVPFCLYNSCKKCESRDVSWSR